MLKKKTEEIMENGVVYIVETYTNSKGEVKGKTKYSKPTGTPSEPVEPEQTADPVLEKLNSIEEQLNALTADSVTLANVEMAIEEGVNEV